MTRVLLSIQNFLIKPERERRHKKERECWIFAIFEDHLLDIFRIRKLSLIFYFGTLLLKITNYIHLTTSLTVHT